MQERLERLIKIVYKKWEGLRPQKAEPHPDEEQFACFLENRLSEEECRLLKAHLLNCPRCCEILAVQLGSETFGTREVPVELLRRLKELGAQPDKDNILEVILKLKEKALELLATSGDVLLGQELVPAPILRSRSISEFKDEVNILKDFKDVRVEAKIENRHGKAFSLSIAVKDKTSQKLMKDLRITLFRDDLELESYRSDFAKATFEHVLLGKYTVEISDAEEKLATVLLDIKV